MTWLLWSLTAPFLWAIVFVIDTYLVDGVYEDEFDGSIVSGLFQLLPWLLVPMGVIEFVPLTSAQTIMAISAGALLLLSFFCYFRALFVLNDAALMQILWNLSVPLVPFLSWVLFSETLLSVHYAGIGLAFLGAVLFSLKGGTSAHDVPKIAASMSGAIVFLALSMVISKSVYETSPNFWSVFLLFSIGAGMAVLGLLLIDRKGIRARTRRIVGLGRKYFGVFLLSEGLMAAGVLASQKAISLAPSVSFVAVVESLTPVFGMMVSFALVLFLRTWGRSGIGRIYEQQFAGLGKKLVAIALIAVGIALVA
jgi:drug/metabolite transporter (DMT)-like permease